MGVAAQFCRPSCFVGVIAALLWSETARSQTTSAAPAGPQAGIEEFFLKKLKADATAAPKGSPHYYAILREGAAELSKALAAAPPPIPAAPPAASARRGARSAPPGPRLTRSPTFVPGNVTPGTLDEDPRAQSAIDRRLAQLMNPVARPRIHLGQRTDQDGDDLFKHAVAVWRPPRQICSGALVGRGAVITAAHCVCDLELDRPGGRVTFGVTLESSNTFNVTGVRRFGTANCAKLQGFDIALVFFSAGNARLPPAAPIAEVGLWFRKAVGYVVGFGATESNPNGGVKLAAEVPIVSHLCATARDRGYGCIQNREAVLLDSISGRDTCSGDSGGPLYVFEGSYQLFGVTSRGLPGATSDAPCDGRGGVYTLLVPEVSRWMFAELLGR